jgi:hypothetical protein
MASQIHGVFIYTLKRTLTIGCQHGERMAISTSAATRRISKAGLTSGGIRMRLLSAATHCTLPAGAAGLKSFVRAMERGWVVQALVGLASRVPDTVSARPLPSRHRHAPTHEERAEALRPRVPAITPRYFPGWRR